MIKIQQTEKEQKQVCIKIQDDPFNSTNQMSAKNKKRPYKKNSNPKNSKSGHWSEDERLKYIIFLEYHSNKFEIKQLRRAWKIFKSMSDFIATRSPDQCRSHHQKMEKRYIDYKDIIQTHKNMIRPDIYQSAFQFYAENVLDKLETSNVPSSLRFSKTNQESIAMKWLAAEFDNFKKLKVQNEYAVTRQTDHQSIKLQFFNKFSRQMNEYCPYYPMDQNKDLSIFTNEIKNNLKVQENEIDGNVQLNNKILLNDSNGTIGQQNIKQLDRTYDMRQQISE